MIKNNVDHKARIIWCFMITALLGSISHGYFFSSNAFSHDSLLLYTSDDIWQISLGRFGMPFYRMLRGYLSVPWLIGVCLIGFATIAVYLISDMYQIRSRWMVAIIAAIIVSCPVVAIQIATFIPWADIYMCSMMLAALGVYLSEKYRFGIVAGCFITALSMSLYPAYFAASCILSIFCVWKKVFDSKADKVKIWKTVARQILLLILSLVVYVVMDRVVLHILQLQPIDNYNSLENAFHFDISLLPSQMMDTFRYVFVLFAYPLGHSSLMIRGGNILFALIFITACINKIMTIWKKEDRATRVVMFLLTLPALLFSAGIIYFINNGTVHGLMNAPFYLLYLSPIILFDNASQIKTLQVSKLVGVLLIVVYGALFFDSAIYSNNCYLYKRLAYDRTNMFMTKLTYHLESDPNYEPGITPVAIIGLPDANEYYKNYNILMDPYYDTMQYKQNIGMNVKYTITGALYFPYYFTYISSEKINCVDSVRIMELEAMQDVIDMPVYPSKDCIKWINDTLVVKVSSYSIN